MNRQESTNFVCRRKFLREVIATVGGLASLGLSSKLAPGYGIPPRLRGVNFDINLRRPGNIERLYQGLPELKGWGINCVRFNFGPFPRGGDDPTVVGKPLLERLNETYETRYAKIVDWCLSNGIWVIFSMIFHNEDTVESKEEWPDGKGYAGFWDDEAAQAEFADAWRQFAVRFKGRKEVLFDLMNEPHGALNTEGNEKSTNGWNIVYPRALAAIRKTDPHRWVIVEPFWGGTSRFERLFVVKDPYVIYSFHFYMPKAFTIGTNKENRYPGFFTGYPWEKPQQWDKAALAARMQPAVEFQRKNGARILVGEFSVGLRVPFKEDRVRWVKDVLELMQERGFNDWLYWSYSAHTHHPKWGGSGFEVCEDLRPLLLSHFRKNN